MPYKEKEIEKLFYSIGEVAEQLGLSQSQIRFYEKEFEQIKPSKNKKGNRLFSVQDIETLKKIQNLLRDKGYTIQGAKQALNLNSETGLKKQQELLVQLQLIKNKIGSMLEQNNDYAK